MKIFQNCKNFALVGAVVLSLAGCGSSNDESFPAVSKAMTVHLPKDFAHLTFRQESFRNSMYPTLVFEGRTSRILVTTKPVLWNHTLAEDTVKIHGLAVTRNDRYFTFTYEANLLDLDAPALWWRKPPCVEDRCRKFTDMQHVTRMEAMRWFYHSDEFTPEKFKDLFGEDAPAKEETA